MRQMWLRTAIATAALLPAAPALAQEAAAPASGFRAEATANLKDAADKLVQLAEAFPQEKYGWRPAAGVRSVAEVFLHVAGANYYLGSFLGEELPAGLGPDFEKETEKSKVVQALKDALAHAHGLIAKLSDAELDKKVKVFGGREATARETLLLVVTHAHEHLGQAIAYARMNGVVPPWSAQEGSGG